MHPYQRVAVVLIKPTHYDDAGFPYRYWRGVLPSNSLAAMNALTRGQPDAAAAATFLSRSTPWRTASTAKPGSSSAWRAASRSRAPNCCSSAWWPLQTARSSLRPAT